MNNNILFRHFSKLEYEKTNHLVGLKKVYYSYLDDLTPCRQIASVKLKKGDVLSSHLHEDIEEHFLFYKGTAQVLLNGKAYDCESGSFLRIPIMVLHEIKALTDVEYLAIGIHL